LTSDLRTKVQIWPDPKSHAVGVAFSENGRDFSETLHMQDPVLEVGGDTKITHLRTAPPIFR